MHAVGERAFRDELILCMSLRDTARAEGDRGNAGRGEVIGVAEPVGYGPTAAACPEAARPWIRARGDIARTIAEESELCGGREFAPKRVEQAEDVCIVAVRVGADVQPQPAPIGHDIQLLSARNKPEVHRRRTEEWMRPDREFPGEQMFHGRGQGEQWVNRIAAGSRRGAVGGAASGFEPDAEHAFVCVNDFQISWLERDDEVGAEARLHQRFRPEPARFLTHGGSDDPPDFRSLSLRGAHPDAQRGQQRCERALCVATPAAMETAVAPGQCKRRHRHSRDAHRVEMGHERDRRGGWSVSGLEHCDDVRAAGLHIHGCNVGAELLEHVENILRDCFLSGERTGGIAFGRNAGQSDEIGEEGSGGEGAGSGHVRGLTPLAAVVQRPMDVLTCVTDRKVAGVAGLRLRAAMDELSALADQGRGPTAAVRDRAVTGAAARNGTVTKPVTGRRVVAAVSVQESRWFLGEANGPWSYLNLAEQGWRHTASELEDLNPEVLLTCWSTPALPERWLTSEDCRLRYVCHLTGSVRHVVPRSFIERGGLVTNWGSIPASAVAEQALLLALAALRNLPRWRQTFAEPAANSERVERLQVRTLLGRRVGIHGFGQVAAALVKLLTPFGVSITAFSAGVPVERFARAGVKQAPRLRDIFLATDVVFECEGLTAQTRHAVGAAELAALPDEGVFVNVARGGLVDDSALLREARTGRIRVALDVFDSEPLPADSPWLQLPWVVLSPHIAGPTYDQYATCTAVALNNVRRYLAHRPVKFKVTPEIYDRAT